MITIYIEEKKSNDHVILDKLSNDYDILDTLSNDCHLLDYCPMIRERLAKNIKTRIFVAFRRNYNILAPS